MGLGLWFQKNFVKTQWRLGLLGGQIPAMLASQAATFRPSSKIPKYNSIAEVAEALRELKWTSDPFNGKLDIVKHPTYMQEAIEKHINEAGDCDDFAAYYAACLKMNHLNESYSKVILGITMWESNGSVEGHCVCVYLSNGSWWYAGNWNGCNPIPIPTMTGFVDDVIKRMNKPLVVSGYIEVQSVDSVGTVFPGKAVMVK